MRHARNFHPEWGYLAPRPGFMRTARLVVVASAVGAVAGAAVVISLMDKPLAEGSVAARTLVQQPVAATAAVTVSAGAQPQTDSRHENSQIVMPNSGLQQNIPLPAYAGGEHLAASDSATTSTASRSGRAATLAEIPAMTDAPPPQITPSPQITSEAAAVPQSPAPAAKAVTTRPRQAYRAPPRYGAPRYAAPRYEQQYMQFTRGPFAYLRPFGSQEY